ncbi:MAG: type II toxin-antitoxin system VapC family toxin [Bacteroidia bacterium]|nr:type II toxin-antitoxin system VapC family toxin [Bacteroidia bacterium]
MGKRYLIDTNIIIYFLSQELPPNSLTFISKIIDYEFNLSVISKIEVLGYPNIKESTVKFIALANVFNIDDRIVDVTIQLRREYLKIKLPDAIIAATALVNNFELITRNTKDFKKIKSLKVIDPFDL